MIYLDHNATTPIAPEVLEAMMPYLTNHWGNPSSSYRFGSKLKAMIGEAREQVAELIGAHPREIVFTSSGTESNNGVINGGLKSKHSAVLNYCMGEVPTELTRLGGLKLVISAMPREAISARPIVSISRGQKLLTGHSFQ